MFSKNLNLPSTRKRCHFKDSRFPPRNLWRDAYMFKNLFYLPCKQLWRTMNIQSTHISSHGTLVSFDMGTSREKSHANSFSFDQGFKPLNFRINRCSKRSQLEVHSTLKYIRIARICLGGFKCVSLKCKSNCENSLPFESLKVGCEPPLVYV